jgi:hypothetical protein
VLFRAAAAHGFAWTVHRPHTLIGYAPGNAMNMGQTLAVCRESGEPFIFPGSHEQWNALTDVSDARIVAQQLAWAATTSAAHGQAYNISNGDLFRWRWLWPHGGTPLCSGHGCRSSTANRANESYGTTACSYQSIGRPELVGNP